MIYYILRPIVSWALKLYFKKIYISGLENIPKDKAVVFASNHPSAFIEPCLLACFLPIQLHFLVRGDLFSVGWLSWLLKGTNQIPIFRQRDGLDNVRKNFQTQDKVRELFAENKAVLMFPEAHTHENLFLRPLAKGIARFSFMDHGADCYIVPIGVNFDRNIPFNSKVSIVIGEPLRVEDYKSQSEMVPARQMNSMLTDLTVSMKECLRHIDNEESEDTILKVYRLLDNERRIPIFPVQSTSREIFNEEKRIASILDESPPKLGQVQEYLSGKTIEKASKPSLLDLMGMIIFLPLFMVGFCLHILWDRLAKYIVETKAGSHEFRAPIYVALIIFQYIFLVILLLILIPFLGKIGMWLFLIFVSSGLFSVAYLKLWGNKLKYILRWRSDSDHKTNLHKIIFK